MVQAKKSKKAKRVIPGFGLSLGVTITLLSLVVLIPLAALVIYTAQMSPSEFWEAITRERVLASYKVSFITAFIASLINAVMGVILAWVLVRYKFPGKRILDGMIELPFALPTAVAGITLSKLFSDSGFYGKIFAKFGIRIAYTKTGLVIALIFVGIPFVVRAVQPVLEKMDGQYEEAAFMLGASRRKTFLAVILPELRPALLTGFGLAFARGIGEYGSVIYISGNSAKDKTPDKNHTDYDYGTVYCVDAGRAITLCDCQFPAGGIHILHRVDLNRICASLAACDIACNQYRGCREYDIRNLRRMASYEVFLPGQTTLTATATQSAV